MLVVGAHPGDTVRELIRAALPWRVVVGECSLGRKGRCRNGQPEVGGMTKTTGRSSAGSSRTRRPDDSKHSHFEFGSTRGQWDRDGGSDFAITTVNIPDRLDAQEVRARAVADSGPPSVRRFHRADITRAIGWLVALAVLGAVAWGAIRLAGVWREASSPRSVERQIGQALGMPVSVRATELRLLPSPRLVVSDVLAAGGLRLPEVAVHFNWRDALRGVQNSTWVLGEARVAPVELNGEHALTLLQSVRRASQLSAAVSTIRFESVSFADLVLLPGQYEAVVRRGVGQRGFDMLSVRRLDGTGQMELEVKPAAADGGSASFRLFATRWAAAVGPAVTWNEATAQGEFDATRLKVDSYSVGAPFGNFNGSALLAAEGGGWRLSGNLRSPDLSVEELIRYLTGPGSGEAAAVSVPFRGTVKIELALAGSGATVADVVQGASAAGPASVSGATISGMNLGVAATQGSASGAGGITRLTDLDLVVTGSTAGLAVRSLSGRAGGLRVQGGFTVDRQLQLRGAVRSEVASPRGVAGADIQLGGTIGKPEFR